MKKILLCAAFLCLLLPASFSSAEEIAAPDNTSTTSSSEHAQDSEKTNDKNDTETTETTTENENNAGNEPILPPTIENNEPSLSEIRQLLLHDQLITQEELDTYSDQQLANAYTLFKRYNSDLMGMDLSSYVRTLNALYRDHTLNWELIAPQLSFNPNDYKTMHDLLPYTERLRQYILALYPASSSFVPIKNVSAADITRAINTATAKNLEATTLGGKISILKHALGLPASTPAATTQKKNTTKKTAKKAAANTKKEKENTTESTTENTDTSSSEESKLKQAQSALLQPLNFESPVLFYISVLGVILIGLLIYRKKKFSK